MIAQGLPALGGALAGAWTPPLATNDLSGAVVVTHTATGDLTVDKPLAGACAVATSVSAALSVEKPLAGSLAVAVTTAGGFAFEGLQGTLAVTPSVTADLTAPIRISGGVTVVVTTSAALSLDKPLVGHLDIRIRTRGGIGGPGLVRAAITIGPRVSGSLIWVARTTGAGIWLPAMSGPAAWRSRIPATVTFASEDLDG